jgi:hypothetical protein
MENKSVFLDYHVLEQKGRQIQWSLQVKQERIRFEFPDGFAQLRLIEECRALNCLDVSDPDNFDFMFDITMQMLVGKPVLIYFYDDTGNKHEVERFVVTDRYMNLRGVDFIEEYPVVVNWLVEFVSGELAKKFPRSLNDIRSKMSERKEERMKKQKKEAEIRTSF